MPADPRRTEQSTSFDREAALYDRARPGYPDAIVDWLLGVVPGAADGHRRAGRMSPIRVLDLGSGTGKLTRSLVARALDVVAVDPGARLLEALSSALPGVETHLGTAESIPLPDGSVDAVVCGQAWHWVDAAVAAREVARVLRPGGALGLVWNIRDETMPWVARLSEVMGSSAAESALRDDPVIGEPFGRTESFAVPWTRRMTVDDLVDLALSRSYLITATEERRGAVVDGIRRLAASDPDLAGRPHLDLPYTSHAFRAVRP